MTSRYSPTKPVLVLIGPSGSGKSTIAIELLKTRTPRFQLVPKYTTRPSRKSEIDTVSEDIFIDEKTFADMQAKQSFMGTVQPFGLPYKYGLSWLDRIQRRHIPLVLLRSFVLSQFLAYYPNCTVYQIVTDKKIAQLRMQDRGQSSKDIEARMVSYDAEIKAGAKKTARTFKNDGDAAQLSKEIAKTFLEDINGLL